jgi:CubicO group peptidase (beta-lactamase class C family)
MQRCFFCFRRLFGLFSGSLSGPYSYVLLLSLSGVLLAACTIGLPQIGQSGASKPRPADYWPTQEWRTATPEEQGLDSAKLADVLRTIRERGDAIHSLLVVRNGRVLADATFYPYDGRALHEVASVTKSIMATLIGIAADQGRLSLDDKMLSFFPDRTVANRDARKEAITVRHLSSMSSGLDCTAEGDEKTLKEMRASEDWVQFALDRPVRWEPGKQFVYCSPAIHLLSPILEKATGMTALDFARRYLFEPLGITDVMWLTDPQGHNRGSEGIYLHPQDMARLGYLWLNGGAWDGKQIVSRAWVEDAVKPHLAAGEDDAYGYGIWTNPEGGDFEAIGRGGQRIAVSPGGGTIVVTTGGGFEWDDIAPLLVGTVGDLEKPLPANPEGVADLRAAEAAVARPPAAKAPAPLPPIAQEISGKTFVFADNALGIESMGFDFGGSTDPAEATMRIKTAGSTLQTWPLGLDGVLRMSKGPYDLPQGVRGEWEDDKTFVAEYDNIGNNDHIFLRLRFAGDAVSVEGQETAHELGTRAEGHLQQP